MHDESEWPKLFNEASRGGPNPVLNFIFLYSSAKYRKVTIAGGERPPSDPPANALGMAQT